MGNTPTMTTCKDFMRERNRMILDMYFRMMKEEEQANPIRAQHIGKAYYAHAIAMQLTRDSGPISPAWILKIINKTIRHGDNESR